MALTVSSMHSALGLATVLVLLTSCCAAAGVSAQTKLVCCVALDPPTVFAVGAYVPTVGDTWEGAEVATHFEGMGIDLILAVFNGLLPEVEYSVMYTGSFAQSLYQSRIGECDISVNSFFMAYSRSSCADCPSPDPAIIDTLVTDDDWEEYACCVDFSHAYFEGGWSLMTLEAKAASINVFKIVFSKPIVQAACFAILFVFAVAHLMWICERSVYDDIDTIAKPYLFSKKYLDGLRDGTWFASTTVMSNSLHNKTIMTGPGRLVAVVWVAYGLFLCSLVTSILSSTLTTQQLQAVTITTASDMAGKSICMEAGFYEYFWTSTFPTVGTRMTLVNDESDCFEAVINGTVDAAFSIRETFIAYFKTGAGKGLASTPVVADQSYALAWGKNFTMRLAINTAILNWIEGATAVTPAYKDSLQEWYGGDAGVFSYGSGSAAVIPWNWPLIGATCGILGIYMLLQGIVIAGTWLHSRSNVNGDPSFHDTDMNADGSNHGSLHGGKSFNGKLSWVTKMSGILSSNIDDTEMRRSESRRPSDHHSDTDSTRHGPSKNNSSSNLFASGNNNSSPFTRVTTSFNDSGRHTDSGRHNDSGRQSLQLAVQKMPAMAMLAPKMAVRLAGSDILAIVTPPLPPAPPTQRPMVTGTEEDDKEEASRMVDEVVRHVGDVFRAQVRTQVREAISVSRTINGLNGMLNTSMQVNNPADAPAPAHRSLNAVLSASTRPSMGTALEVQPGGRSISGLLSASMHAGASPTSPRPVGGSNLSAHGGNLVVRMNSKGNLGAAPAAGGNMSPRNGSLHGGNGIGSNLIVSSAPQVLPTISIE